MPTTPTSPAAGERSPPCRLGAGRCPQQRRGACGCPPQSGRNRTSRGAVGRQPVDAGEGVNKRMLMAPCALHPTHTGQTHLVPIAEVKQVGHDGLQGHLASSLLPPGQADPACASTHPSASPIQGKLDLVVGEMDTPYSRQCRCSHCWWPGRLSPPPSCGSAAVAHGAGERQVSGSKPGGATRN